MNMTPKTPADALLPVTQADRDAAEAFRLWIFGDNTQDRLVQAFANHRLASLATPPGEDQAAEGEIDLACPTSGEKA